MLQSVLVAAGLVLAVAQTGAQQFAGTWTRALDGKTYVRLELRESAGMLSGRISLGRIHVDKDGVVDEVLEPATNFTPIFDVRLQNGVVSFARKDGDDIDRFEIRIVAGDVQLTFVPSAEDRAALAREGVPLPKPARLVRAAK
jgi:hypothetical protein